MFGFSEGRYRKPDPAECSGMMKMSYLPFGRPDDLGFWPCGGGGGGGGSIVVEWDYSARIRTCVQIVVNMFTKNVWRMKFDGSGRDKVRGILEVRRMGH